MASGWELLTTPGAAINKWGGAARRTNEALTITDEELADLLGYGQRAIGTQTAQSQNRMQDVLGYNRAPLGTQTSAQAGAAYTGQLALEKFGFDLQQLKQGMDADAMKFLLDFQMRQKAYEDQKNMQYWQMLTQPLGMIGYGIGSQIPIPGGG